MGGMRGIEDSADEAPQKGLAPPAPSTPPAPSPSSEGLTFLLWAGVLAVLAFLVYWFVIRGLRRSDTKAEARRVSVSRDLEAGQAEPEAGPAEPEDDLHLQVE